jgi:uncharacterized RDD family membrane protein YckC
VKCPKCGYIGFEAVDRCRNCGYEFALAVRAPQRDDLEMRSASDPIGPLADLSLKATPQPTARRRTPAGKEIDLDRLIGAPDAPADLPLFETEPAAEIETPLIPPPAPRKPLAVRREAAPYGPSREDRSTGAAPRENLVLPLPRSVQPAAAAATDHEGVEMARPVPRFSAAVIDVLLLAAIDAIVLYFTVRLCSLTMADVTMLPLVPFLAFLLLLDGGYLIAFTAAGGQTIGKMALGLKVVGPDDATVPVTTATLRSAAALVSALCLGAGLFPALFGGRALHDRLADTRVVHVTL